MRFVDLFAGLGGFHVALSTLGHECVFASEIDDELRIGYQRNFRGSAPIPLGDIRACKGLVPDHDILCAGFPCQPFSKSGSQKGLHDKTRGTLFDDILDVLERRRPSYVLLENVGNFERHDKGNTWRTVQDSLQKLDYDVRGTEHITSGGHGLISPHHLGFPHHRERFFIVASQYGLPPDPFPPADRTRVGNLEILVHRKHELTPTDVRETALSQQQEKCVNHWNLFLRRVPKTFDLPSFPIWGDEFGATYPYEDSTPYASALGLLRRHVPPRPTPDLRSRDELLAALPSYARTRVREFPSWKVRFINQNRGWYRSIRHRVSKRWLDGLNCFPASLRKLEWNCQGEVRDLWYHVLQFRPSGLRVKRYTSCPALVAMTTTQIPILGPEHRFLTRREGLRLQGFPDTHILPASREATFRALGNAVHVGVVSAIAERLLHRSATGEKGQLRPRGKEDRSVDFRSAVHQVELFA